MKKTRDLFKRNRYQGNISSEMGIIKDINSMDLAEADNINTWREYTEELYKNILTMMV